VWSEGANFRVGSFIGDVRTADGAALRMEVSGYQVCVRDAAGQAWFFRNVPIDVWP
jgi:hypothetical protein